MTVAATPAAAVPVVAPPVAPNFAAVAQELRRVLQAVPSTHPAKPPIWYALERIEHELTAQAWLYLADRLVYWEDVRRAALLAAYATPVELLRDDRIRAFVARLETFADAARTPEVELATFALTAAAPPSAEMVAHMGKVGWATNWALWWLSCCRLCDAHVAGLAVNLAHLAQLEPEIRWIGVDAHVPSVAASRAQLDAAGVHAVQLVEDPADSLRAAADCVGVLHVLEHTVHPEALLDRAERYVRPGGVVCLAAPDGTWAPHAAKPEAGPAFVGQHCNVWDLGRLTALGTSRGRMIDARKLPALDAYERNGSVCVAYRVAGGTP